MGTGLRRRLALAAVLAAGAVVGGCSTAQPSAAQAGVVAQAFYTAVNQHDGSAACALLAPGTAHEIEQSAGSACDTAITVEQLPDAKEVERVDADGRAARVVMHGDVVFLTVYGGGWKVLAAGCTSRPQQPYECTLKGS